MRLKIKDAPEEAKKVYEKYLDTLSEERLYEVLLVKASPSDIRDAAITVYGKLPGRYPSQSENWKHWRNLLAHLLASGATVSDIAEIAGVTRATIYAWKNQKLI